MINPASTRAFLRLVVACAILVNGLAALVVQGERDLRPYSAAVVLDRDGPALPDELGAHGAAVERHHATLGDAQP